MAELNKMRKVQSHLLRLFMNNYKNDKSSDRSIESEADQIFKKSYADRYKTFPKINKDNFTTQYAKDYQGVYNQVKKTRKNGTYSAK
jgi:hypothetical protein